MTPENRDKALGENKALSELEQCMGWALFMEELKDKLTAAQRGNENLATTPADRDSYLREKLTLRELTNWLRDKREKNTRAINGKG